MAAQAVSPPGGPPSALARLIPRESNPRPLATLNIFVYLTVDGFFVGPKGEIDWFKAIAKDPEFEAYTHEDASGRSTLLMGHTTYKMMKSYWPTPQAAKTDPEMADVMRESPKIVFSKKLKTVTEAPNWRNITLPHRIDPAAVTVPIVLGAGSPCSRTSRRRA